MPITTAARQHPSTHSSNHAPGVHSVASHLFSAPIILPLQNSTVLLRTLFKL